MGVNTALTFLSWVILTVVEEEVGSVIPLPVQPENTYPLAGVALIGARVPCVTLSDSDVVPPAPAETDSKYSFNEKLAVRFKSEDIWMLKGFSPLTIDPPQLAKLYPELEFGETSKLTLSP